MVRSTVSRFNNIQDNHIRTICVFFVRLLGNQRLEERLYKIFISFKNKTDAFSPNEFKRVNMNDIPSVEDLLTLTFLLYDIDIVDGNSIGELARQSVQNYDITPDC